MHVSLNSAEHAYMYHTLALDVCYAAQKQELNIFCQKFGKPRQTKDKAKEDSVKDDAHCTVSGITLC